MLKPLSGKTETTRRHDCQDQRNPQRQRISHHWKNFHNGFLKRGTSQMQGTPKVCKIINVIVGGQQYKQIRIPSYILQTSHAQDIYTRTFIDCGANINCIDYDFAQRNRIPLRKLDKPLLVNNVDGSPNEARSNKHSVTLFIQMGGIIHKEEFYTIKCGKDNIILGLPWLNCVNPTINWVNKHVDIHEATDQAEEYNLATSSKPFTIRKATQEPPTHPKLLP